MKISCDRGILVVILVIIFSFILFFPGFFTFFHQDDFFHLSRSLTVNQVITAFNIFSRGEFPFYRPIPTQLYFFINYTLFQFNPLGYHIVNFIIFSLNIILIYRFILYLTQKSRIAAIAIVIYGINSTHVAPLYSPAYVHELLLVFFGVLSIHFFTLALFHKQRKFWIKAILFFVFALMTKETAVVLPGLMVLVYFFFYRPYFDKKLLIVMIPFAAIEFFYFLGHFLFYGLASSPSYQVVIGKPTLVIFVWYILWALSTPNIFVDFVLPGLRINPVFFQVAKVHGYIYLICMGLLIISGMWLNIFLIKYQWKIKNTGNLKLIAFGMLWFFVSLIPLLPFPYHKLATEQAMGLVGISLSVGVVLSHAINCGNDKKFLSYVFLTLYLLVAVNSIILARRTHWIVISARQAEQTINYIQYAYPNLSNDAILYFRNGEIKIPQYGSSRQLYQALGNGVGLKMYLNKPDLKLYFEDINQLPISFDKNKMIEIDSSQLLGY